MSTHTPRPVPPPVQSWPAYPTYPAPLRPMPPRPMPPYPFTPPAPMPRPMPAPSVIVNNNLGALRPPRKPHSVGLHVLLAFTTGGIGNLIYALHIHNHNARLGY